MSDEPKVVGYFYKGDYMGDQFSKLCLKHFYRAPGAGDKEFIQPVALIKQEDHLAHVTRLQAEVERRDSKLETMRRKNNELNDTEARLQSELTKARELINHLYVNNELSIADNERIEAFAKGTQNVDVSTFKSLGYALERLSNQSAPADKET
jgi:predicted nuclease with TOPRIM domain